MKSIWVILAVLALGACERNAVTDAEPVEPEVEAPAVVAEPAPAVEAEVEVIPLQHGSLLLKAGDLVIAVDPVAAALEAAPGDEPTADLILVTHQHGDHLDPASITTLRKVDAPVVVPARVAKEASAVLPTPVVMANGETQTFLDGRVQVEAVPMYNLKRKRENGEFYHPKGMGNGYVVTVAKKRIYLSGDTECTPEMKALKNIDMAFVCMNLPYTMVPDEAAECVREFKPKVLYPYHYRGQDPTTLVSTLADVPEVEIRQLEWYPEAK